MAPLNGRKVFAIAASFFGVVIAVNGVMAYVAERSFPGLEQEIGNGYEESQAFDRSLAAQQALGWRADLSYRDRQLRIDLRNRAGAPAPVARLDVLVGRPTIMREDRRPAFIRAAGVYTAAMDLGPGKWMVLIDAVAADGTAFHQRLSLIVGE